jgi:hypothetical protein
MTTDGVSLAAFIILLFTMLYFQMTSPTFLLVKLDVPEVTRLLRGQFNFYFLALTVAAALGTLAFGVAGRPFVAVEIAAIAAFAFFARRWLVQNMDAALAAKDNGDTEAVRRLRALHWRGMLWHAVPLAAMLASIPQVFKGWG